MKRSLSDRNVSRTKTFICAYCGEEERAIYSAKNMYCSRKCSDTAHRGFKHSDESLLRMSKAQKGRIVSEKTRKKMSIARKGIRVSPATEFKKGEHRAPKTEFKVGSKPWHKGRTGVYKSEVRKAMGAKNFSGSQAKNWKGGITPLELQLRRSKDAKSWRDKVFLRDNYTCQMCFEYGIPLHADHIKSWKDYPGLRYDLDNGRTLCIPCHYYITFKRIMPIGNKWGLRTKLIGKEN